MRWLTLLIIAPSAAMAGWTQAPGAIYLQANNRLLIGERGYDRHGTSRPLGAQLVDWRLNLYGEYGLTADWTLVFAGSPVGYTRVEGDPARRRSGARTVALTTLGPIAAGARRRLLAGPLALSVEARYGYAPEDLRILHARFAECGPPCEGYTVTPARSAHRLDATAQLGISLPGGVWLRLDGGGQWASGELGAALTGFGQVGWQGPWGLVLDLHVTIFQSLSALERNEVLGTHRTRYVGRGVGLQWWFTDNVALQAGVDGAFRAAANAAIVARTVGLAYRSR